MRANRELRIVSRAIALLALLLSIPYSLFADSAPPLPPGYKPALRAPRQITTLTGASMSRAVFVPPATNAPTTLIIRGWGVRDGVVVPWLALRLNTNAPKVTVFSIIDATNSKCVTTTAGGSKGDLVDFGYCTSAQPAGMFKVVLHD